MANYEEFMDPNSAIARIIAQMQGAADRSNPGPGPGMPGDLPVTSVPQPGGAQPGPVGAGPGMQEMMGTGMDPQALIERLLAGQVNQ